MRYCLPSVYCVCIKEGRFYEHYKRLVLKYEKLVCLLIASVDEFLCLEEGPEIENLPSGQSQETAHGE